MSEVRLAASLVLALATLGCSAAPGLDPVSGTPTSDAATTPATTPRGSTPPVASPQETPVPAPAPDAWIEAGEFSDHRVVTRLVPLGTEEVLAVGADDVCGVASDGSDTAEVGDPLAGTWSAAANLPSRRVGPVLVGLADGRALVTAGMTGENEGAIAKSSTVVFDPVTRAWSRSGLLNTARIDPAAAALLDGGALVAGGLYLDESNDGRVKDTAEVWDPATGEWSQTGRLSEGRWGAAAARLVDGRVLVAGGLPTWDADVGLASAEIYDPTTGRWSPAGSLDEPRRGFSLVPLADGGALVTGGALVRPVIADGETFYPFEPTTTAERFDPATSSWSRINGIESQEGVPTAALMGDGRVLVVTGTHTAIYDPASGRWQDTTPIPGGRHDASAVLLGDGSVLVGGGWSEWPDRDSTPSCPIANAQLWRFVPGS